MNNNNNNDSNKQYNITLSECLNYLNEDLHYINNGRNYYNTKSPLYIDSFKFKNFCIEGKIDYKNINQRYLFNINDVKELKNKINNIVDIINSENIKINNHNKKIKIIENIIDLIFTPIDLLISYNIFTIFNNYFNNKYGKPLIHLSELKSFTDVFNYLYNDYFDNTVLISSPLTIFMLLLIIIYIVCVISFGIVSYFTSKYYKNYYNIEKNILDYIDK